MGERILSQEEKFRVVAQALQTPDGRARLGQTMDSNVALDSDIQRKTPLFGKTPTPITQIGQEDNSDGIKLKSFMPVETVRGESPTMEIMIQSELYSNIQSATEMLAPLTIN